MIRARGRAARAILLISGLTGLLGAWTELAFAQWGSISTSPTSITFRYTLGGPLPGAQSVTVTVSGGRSWSTFDISPFYDATPACAFGTCRSGTSTRLQPSSRMTRMAAGTHRADLTVRSSGLPDRIVPVTLIVSEPESSPPPPPPPPPPSITAEPAAVTFNYTRGGALPPAQSVRVTVSSGGAWSTFDQSGFYNATPACAFGTCPSGSSTSLAPSSGMTGFPAGTHQAALTVRASGVGDVVVPVSVVVSDPASPQSPLPSAPPPPSSTQTTLYVSPSGSDANPGTEAQPFLTIDKARSVVQAMNGAMSGDIRVLLRGGEYRLSSTLTFTAADSGSNGYSVIYAAYPGETPVITGGQRITGWTAVGNGVYRAPVGGLRFRQLYVNGVRAIRARTPNAGSYHAGLVWDEGGQRVQVPGAVIGPWSRLNEVEMVILGGGVNQANLRISSLTASGSSVVVVGREPERGRLFSQRYPIKAPGRPYYFENALEFLDAPGEWYLHPGTGEVFYKLRLNESAATLDVVAPRLETLVALRGTLSQPVHHLQFHGLTFQDSTWLVPDAEGYVGDQASIVYTQALPADEIASYPGHRLPAGFHLEAASNIRLERNTFRRMGASAVNLFVAAHDNAVVGNVITDVSGSGISVDLNLEGNPSDTRKVSRRNTIANNYIARTGRDYYQTVGIMVGYGDATVIEHNELVEMPYSGISVGWGWADRDNAARNNLIRHNKVTRVLQLMDDGGGIYTLSRQPGTVVAENHVHDLGRPPHPIDGIYEIGGIYLDNGSNLITVRDNVIQGVEGAIIKTNGNGPSNTVFNNDASSAATMGNAGLEPAYQDIRPSP